MWFLAGLIVAALLIWAAIAMNHAGKQMRWYEWLIGIIGVGLLLFTAQNYFGSLNEVQPKAANMFLLVTGLPAVILILVAWQLWARRKKTA